MTISLNLQVPKELVKRVRKLDNASVAAKCNNEIQKRVKYLETVLKGWKTYKHVNEEHSRLLYMMLMSDNEDGLHDYEKLVMVPKIVESENAVGPQTSEESEPTVMEPPNASGPTTSEESKPSRVESTNTSVPQTNKESKPTIVESVIAPGPQTSKKSESTKKGMKNAPGPQTSKKSKPTIVELKNVSGPQTNKKSKPTKVDSGNASTTRTSNEPDASKKDKKVETALQIVKELEPTTIELESTVGAENNNKELAPTVLDIGSVGGPERAKDPTQSALEKVKLKSLQEPTPAKVLDMGSSSSSTTSSVDLGAESSESSNGEESGSSSPTVEYQPLINEEKFTTPQIVIEDYDDKMFKIPIGIPIRSRARINSLKNNAKDSKANAVSTSDNASSTSVSGQAETVVDSKKHLPSVSETVDSRKIQEDRSVVSSKVNKIFACNILMTAQRVKSAMGNMDVFCPGHESKLIASANEMGLGALGGNDLINLVNNVVNDVLNSKVNREVNDVVNEVVNDAKNDNILLSQGAMKRRKKAAKKAAAIAAAERKKIEAEANHQHQVMMAKEALKTLDKCTPKDENPDVPVTSEELELYHNICRSGQKVFPEGSKEKALMDKFEANKDKLKAYIAETYSVEQKFNKMCMNQIQGLSNEILHMENNPLTEDQQHDKAIAYVIKKLDFWKKSENIQAGYYVDMYAYLLENMTPSHARIISGFVPYECLPNSNFEQTLLIRFQAGKLQTHAV